MVDLVGVEMTSPYNQTPATNQTNDDEMTHCVRVERSVQFFFVLVYTVVFLVGFVLNSFTVKIYFCSAQQQVSSIMLVYLKNLAASDFLLCLCLPFNIANYASSSITVRLIFCNFAASAFFLNMYASILFMGYIAANRYLKIVHPLKTHVLQTVQAARIISVVTWVFLLATGISYVTLSLLTQEALTVAPDCCDALHSTQLNVFYKIIQTCSFTIFLFVLVSLVFFYYSASRTVSLAQQRQPASSSCKKLVKSRRNMLVLVSVFCICFIPYHLIHLPCMFLLGQCSLSQVFYYVEELTILLSVLNICLDPFIYFIFSKVFRVQPSQTNGTETQSKATESQQ